MSTSTERGVAHPNLFFLMLLLPVLSSRVSLGVEQWHLHHLNNRIHSYKTSFVQVHPSGESLICCKPHFCRRGLQLPLTAYCCLPDIDPCFLLRSIVSWINAGGPCPCLSTRRGSSKPFLCHVVAPPFAAAVHPLALSSGTCTTSATELIHTERLSCTFIPGVNH